MIEYCTNSEVCRRKMLFKDLDSFKSDKSIMLDVNVVTFAAKSVSVVSVLRCNKC